MIRYITEKALAEEELSREEIAKLLAVEEPTELKRLLDAAYQMKLRYVGNIVHLRGLIEISNYCTKNCYYCGIRKDNTDIKRFEMAEEHILHAAQLAIDFDYGSIVLQSGERSDEQFTEFIESLIKKIKAMSNEQLGITLSLGEQSLETYQRWYDAGAHRYLLRIETSSPEFYKTLHPEDHSFEKRCQCLDYIKQCNYQVGTGVMSGLPGQTFGNLADDIIFFRERSIDMIGMGPYIAHHNTPLGRHVFVQNRPQLVAIGLKMIAATRLVLRNVNIASTTALQALAPDGRERGLLAGANVIMPNIGDVAYRDDYLLYEGKPGLNENAEESREKLEKAIAAIGETIGYGKWGDSPHYKARKGLE